MRTYAQSTIFSNATNHDGSDIVVEVKSHSNPNKVYRVDLTHGRCSCPAWTRTFPRKPCKHLRELGYYEAVEMEVTEKAKAAPIDVTEEM